MTEKERLQQIKKELDEILNKASTRRALGKAELDLQRKIFEQFKKTGGTAEEFEGILKNINDQLFRAQKEVFGIRDAFAESVNELKGLNAGLNRAKKAFQGLESIADKLANDQADIARISLKDLKNIESKVKQRAEELKKAQSSLKLEIATLEAKKASGDATAAELRSLDKSQAALKAVNAELSTSGNLRKSLIAQANMRIDQEKEIIRTMGAAPAILEGVGKALEKIGLPDFGISEAVQNTRDILRNKSDEFKFAQQLRDEEVKILKIRKKQLETTIKTMKAKGQDVKKEQGALKVIEKEIKKIEKIEEGRITSTMALSTLLGQVGKKIKEQFTTANLIQSAFTLLTAAAIKLDKLTGALAKNIGISYDESLALQSNFNQLAISSDNIMVSTSELNRGFLALNKSFQGATGFSDELLQSFTALTAQAGFTEESMVSIAKITGTQGKELESNVALMQGQLEVMNAQEGTSFSTKQLLEGIDKVSKATLLTLRNQPKALARTLMTSAKLVLSFQEMESIASSLLDFEGSIGAELEAELLTGKQINLESARLLALKGDIAGAAAEVAKEVGSAAEFEKMNVIQQEALAKAAGLTREQLASSLMEREALAKLGGQDKTALEGYNRLKKQGLSDEAIATKLGDKRLADQLKSQSIQERFAASVERLQEIFVDLAQALMPVASSIADMVVSVSKIVAKFSPILKPLAIAYGIFKGIQLTTIGIGNMMERITKFSRLTRTLKMQELKTSFGIDKITKSMAFMRQKGFVKAKAAYLLQRLGLLTDKQAVFFRNRIAYFKNRELGLSKVALNYEKGSLLTSIKITMQKRLQALFGKESYFQQIKQNIAEKASNVYNTISTGLLNTKIFLQKILNREKIVEGLIMLKNFAKDAALALLSVGKLALNAAIAVASIPVIGPILAIAAGAAAVAAGMALYNKFKKPAGDMMMADGKTQVSTKEGGLFELSGNDQFVAAPGIADAVTGRNRSQRRENRQQRREERRENRVNDNSRLEESMNKTNKILEIVASNLKPKPLLGSESGQAIHNGTYNLQ